MGGTLWRRRSSPSRNDVLCDAAGTRGGKRVSRRARRRTICWVLGATLLPLLAYGDVVFAGRSICAGLGVAGVDGLHPPPGPAPAGVSDQVRLDLGASSWAFEPWARVVHRQLAMGQLPLWNPFQGLGTPLLANGQSAVGDPLLLPVRLHPTPLGWDIAFLAAFALGGAVTFLYLWHLGWCRAAALTGAAVFVLNGWFIQESNNHFVRSYLYLPALLLCVDLTAEKSSWPRITGLALVVAGNLLVGMPEVSVIVLGMAAAYALWRIVQVPSWRRALALTAGGAVGVLMALPLLLPLLHYLSFAYSTHAPGFQRGLQFDGDASRLLGWVLPFLRGQPLADLAVGGYTGARTWVGCAAVVLALAALTARDRPPGDPTWFMSGATLTLVFKQFGVPPVQYLGSLPGLDAVAFNQWLPPAISFTVAVLAAGGADALLRRRVDQQRFVAVLALASGGLAFLLHLNADALRVGWPYSTARSLAVGLVAGLLVIFAVAAQRRPWAGWLASATAVAEISLLAPHGIYQPRYDTLKEPAWSSTVPITATDRVDGLDGQLYPDTASALGLEDIRSLDALYPRRYVRYVQDFIAPGIQSRFVGTYAYTAEERSGGHIAGNPMFDLLGVRWVLADVSLPDDQALPRVLGDPASAAKADVVTLAGTSHLALLHDPAHPLTVPVVETTPAPVTVVYGLASGNPTTAHLVVDATTSTTTTTVWSGTAATTDGHPIWTTATFSLPPTTRSLSLHLFSPDPHALAAWAQVRIGSPQFHGLGTYAYTTVFQNTHSLPRAFVVHHVTTVATPDAAQTFFLHHSLRLPDGALHVTTFDPARQVVVEAPNPPPTTSCGPPEVGHIHQDDASVVVDVDVHCPGVLVVSDTYTPGWSATVNDHPAPVLPADIALRAVPVPPGHDHVVLHYDAPGLRPGVAAATTAIVALGLTGLAQRRRRRQHPG